MPNNKLPRQTLPLIWVALTWATSAAAGEAPAASDDGNLLILAAAGAVTLFVAILAWRLRALMRAKKPDASAFMTLDQITRLESPGGASTIMKVAQPKDRPSHNTAKPAASNQRPSASDAYMSDLEKQYPRIVEKLVNMWQYKESEEYLQSLTFDDRGDREGFSREVAADIMMLHGVKSKERGDVWQ